MKFDVERARQVAESFDLKALPSFGQAYADWTRGRIE
jgi:hypothetical protein